MIKKLAIVDIETTPFKYDVVPTLLYIGFYDGSTFISWSKDDKVDPLESFYNHIKNEQYLIHAHNGERFDFFYFIKYFNKGNLKVYGNRIAECKIGKSTLRDSYLILPMPLAAYKKDDIDYNLFTLDKYKQNENLIKKYLQSDCKYLYELISEYREQYSIKNTIAQIALEEIKKSGYKVSKTTNQEWDKKYRSRFN